MFLTGSLCLVKIDYKAARAQQLLESLTEAANILNMFNTQTQCFLAASDTTTGCLDRLWFPEAPDVLPLVCSCERHATFL